MAHNRIGRLTERIEALASRRGRPLRIEDLCEDGEAKLDRLTAGLPVELAGARTRYATWTDDAILRRLIELGTFSPADFKAGTVL